MGTLTYYAVLPFVRDPCGDLVPGVAKECSSAANAVRVAQDLAISSAGAIAFSRTGDPATGEFADAEVLGKFGEVLSIDALIDALIDANS
ncbi:MAG: hypothetical protein ACLPID_07325 [Beijerinckiaceae bacterium]